MTRRPHSELQAEPLGQGTAVEPGESGGRSGRADLGLPTARCAAMKKAARDSADSSRCENPHFYGKLRRHESYLKLIPADRLGEFIHEEAENMCAYLKKRNTGWIRKTHLQRHLACEVLEMRLLLAANGADTRHLRLAVTATEEYTAFFGGRTQAQAAIQKTIAGVNKVFQRELNLQLDLIDNLDIIFGPGNSPDPFPSGGPGFVPNQTLVDSVIGTANFDLGILLGGIPVGVAFLGGAGIEGNKAKAFSGFTPEEGGPAGANAIGNALHELAHLLSAQHPANGTLGTCATGRSATSAFEPGSGSTIVAYAGICGSDSIQVFNDDYFHSANLDQMVAHLQMLDNAGVGTKNLATNQIPTVDAGPDRTIPARTPFALTVSGTDADDPSGDSLRYTIEQRDLGPAQALDPFPGDNGTSPLFRSFPPAPAQDGGFTRVFPQLNDILLGVTTKGEYLPTTSRQLNFRATVRDGVGGTNGDDVRLTVIDTGAPFRVTALNAATALAGGATQNVTWDVAGTDANGINASNVDIWLSTDGGLTFPHRLANTANDGSHTVVIPNLNTAAARIKVQGDNHIFFDISDANVSITVTPASPGVAVTGDVLVGEGGVFAPETDTFVLALNTIPTSNVEITVTANSQLAVSIDGVTFATSVTFTRADTSPQTITVRPKNDRISEGAHRGVVSQAITSSSDPAYPTTLVLDQRLVEIADDEQPPLIAVDLQPLGLSVPRNWTEINSVPTSAASTFSQLVREDGMPTDVDLVLTPTPTTSTSATADVIGALSAPIHTPDLSRAGGAIYFDQFFAPGLPSVAVNATWRGLVPGKRYNVYVFAAEHFGVSFSGAPWIVNQQVTISGAGSDNPPPFVQNSTAKQRQLLINDQEGDDTRTLESFAKPVTADGSGEIHIEIRRDDGVDVNRVIISGLAIQEVPPPPPVELDYGDAPDSLASPRYPTLVAHQGPVHTIGELFLGASVDGEIDGQPHDTAGQGASGGDDGSDEDDDDGVVTIATAVTTLNSATTASFRVTASQPGKLDAWIDFNRDNVFADPAEHLGLNSSIDLVAGINVVTFTVPASSNSGDAFGRFRFSSSGDLLPTGASSDGEVEDHLVPIVLGSAASGAAVEIIAPFAGEFQTIAEGDQLVVKTGVTELLRVPGNSLASIQFFGSDGDDVVSLENVSSVFTGAMSGDGRAGTDVLKLLGGQDLDLTTLPDEQIQGFEEIDISDGDNSLTINSAEVINISTASNTLRVKSNTDDTVRVGAGWTISGTEVEGGLFVRILTNGLATLRLTGPHDWTNPVRGLDVNGNTTIEPQDVLVIINELNSPRFSDVARRLANAASLATFPGFYYDTTSDGFVTPQDALIVINSLNGVGTPEAEFRELNHQASPLTAVDWLFAHDDTLVSSKRSFVGPANEKKFDATPYRYRTGVITVIQQDRSSLTTGPAKRRHLAGSDFPLDLSRNDEACRTDLERFMIEGSVFLRSNRIR